MTSRTLSFAVALAAALSLVLAGGPVAAEDESPPSCAAYWPLAVGTVWTYDFRGDAGTTVELRREVVAADARYAELHCKQGGHDFYEYVSTRTGGIEQLQNAYLGGDRGVHEAGERTPLLRGPIVEGASWRWTSYVSVQTCNGDPGPPADDLRIEAHATIEAVDDVVQVPAGRFTAARVRVATTCRFLGDGETTTWWVEGVGPVKVVTRSRGAEEVTELRAFTSP